LQRSRSTEGTRDDVRGARDGAAQSGAAIVLLLPRRPPRCDTTNAPQEHGDFRLLKAHERLSFQERRWLCELFQAEPLLAEAWALNEAFRAIYRSTSRVEAEQRLERFLVAVDRAAMPSFSAFADGVRLWREELLAYFEQPISNGYAEGVINKIK
jgi:transposase